MSKPWFNMVSTPDGNGGTKVEMRLPARRTMGLWHMVHHVKASPYARLRVWWEGV